MKLQYPSSNIQRITNPQAPNIERRRFGLNIGAWSFSGAWVLVLGACLTLALTSCAMGQSLAKPSFQVAQQYDRLIITYDSKPVAHFVFRDTNIFRPYFAHVHTPDGIQVTRNHPPIAGIDPVDHATMHPGIWLAFGDISGQDFWRNKAAIRHDRFTSPPKAGHDRLTFATESTLIATNGDVLAKLHSDFTIASLPDGYLLSWKATFTPLTDNFSFGDQEEMGFGVRVATALSEKNGGMIRNSDGITGAKAAWGKTANWCDYSGIISNRLVGMTVLSDPKNFRVSWFHSRDYGLLEANPFGRKAFTKGEPSSIPVTKGKTFQLRFAAFIHSTPTNQPPDIAAAYGDFTNEK
jgi:hypothetical protein